MSEDNIDQDEKPSGGQESTDIKEIEYREISEEQLDQILEDHKIWLESDGKEGKRADFNKVNLKNAWFENANLQKAIFIKANLKGAFLSGANLRKANFYKANLQEVNFADANLKEAKFYKANLQRAYLSKANLIKANLSEANVQEADLYEANLQEAAVFEANLNRVKLYKANLKKANLIGSDLREADLFGTQLNETLFDRAKLQNSVLSRTIGISKASFTDANLDGATGLLGNEFAQADVTGAKLPDGIKDFKALDIVEKTSENARKIFFAMLLGCVYSWLTIATTTDVRLLTNTASSPLPIIGTEIPIAWFYIAAPLVLISLYFYFHLYLIKLWETLSGLPAKFPDGKRLDEIAYPWLLNGLVRRHFELLKENRPFIAHVQECLSIFLAWWVVPITMTAFWLRFIPRHDWKGTSFHIFIITISISFGIIIYKLCVYILNHGNLFDFRKRNSIVRTSVMPILFTISIFSLLSFGSIEGDRHELLGRKVNFFNSKEVVPWIFKSLGYDVFANFKEKKVSEIPINYGLISKDERIDFVIGANLKNADLRNALGINAFLVKSDLRYSNLSNSILNYINLQNANLELANLLNTHIMYANLKNSNLTSTNLENSELSFSNFQGANFINANLKNATLIEANLNETIFSEHTSLKNVILIEADLTMAKGLTIEHLLETASLYKTIIDHDIMEQVKISRPELLEKPPMWDLINN